MFFHISDYRCDTAILTGVDSTWDCNSRAVLADVIYTAVI